jgi:enhancing lycopene biosynthesis protein 2
MTKKIGVLLSGCGALDGSEIHEAVLTLLALDRAGVEILCTAPDIDQFHVINHLTQEETPEVRNVLVESARIARGNLVDIDALDAQQQQMDGLILPGGFGAVKSLCTFALKGPEGNVDPRVLELLRQVHAEKKPIGAISISPATVVMALKAYHPSVTIGTDANAAAAIHTMGGGHHACKVDEICVDPVNRIVSTPGYMLGTGIREIATGIEKLVQKVLELIGY